MGQKKSLFNFLELGLLVFCYSACADNVAPNTTIQKPPNIIWLVAEDQSSQWFPMYGDSTISLPNLESLSKDGVIFDNAVSPVPVCAPARSTLITGMYPTTLGTHNMRTYTSGRKMNQPTLDSLRSYSPVVPEGVKMFTEYLRGAGYYTANGPKEDYNFAKTDAAWDESSGSRHWRKRNEDQPFFAVFNFSVCHESQIWQRSKDSLFVDPTAILVPPYFPDTKTVRHDMAVNYSNLKRLDDQIGNILSQLKEDGLYENSIIFFYGDHGGPFPRYKRALYDTGLKVPLVIKFPNGKKSNTRDNRFISFIDYAPTILSLAGIEPSEVMQGTAQFGAFEKEKKPQYTFHTSDRFDEIYDRLRAVRSDRYKYIKNFNTDLSHALPVSYREQMPMMAELRKLNKEGKLDENEARWLSPTKPEEELYDLQEDPYELINLAAKPELRDTLDFYRAKLYQWIAETNDLGEFAERDLVCRWLVEGEQPKLAPIQMEETNLGIELSSTKSDATLVWKPYQDSIWKVYTEPISKTISFEAKAERIGYTASAILSYQSQ